MTRTQAPATQSLGTHACLPVPSPELLEQTLNEQMSRWMDVWMDGQMDRLTDEWMDGLWQECMLSFALEFEFHPSVVLEIY